MAERFNIADFAYAHRGLWSADSEPENSLAACLAAAEEGLGIEFDVRPAADGVPVIFHDPVLDRMTHETGAVADKTSAELTRISLHGGDTIPSLQTLLDTWPAQTPLLCELKIDGATDAIAFARRVAEMLDSFNGPAAIMSFSTAAVAAVPPRLMRGQLILPSARTGAADLAATPEIEVDYLACHVSDADNDSLQQARDRRPLVTWTVADASTCAALAAVTDSQIFEGFDPKLAKRHILNT